VFTPSISIGSDVSLGEFNHITAINSISIGDGVLTGRWVTISDNAHGNLDDDTALMPSERDLYSKGSVTIEDNVWIGDKVTILPNVRIGEGSVIGANSVVTKDIPPFCVAAGNPAKIIRKLNEHKSR
jgi:acetyltransferase-like isoleucine patch superfamily enzyme